MARERYTLAILAGAVGALGIDATLISDSRWPATIAVVFVYVVARWNGANADKGAV